MSECDKLKFCEKFFLETVRNWQKFAKIGNLLSKWVFFSIKSEKKAGLAFCRIIIQLEFGEFVVYSVVAFFAITQNGRGCNLIVNFVGSIALLTDVFRGIYF